MIARYPRTLLTAMTLAAVSTLAACAPLAVRSFSARNTQLSQYHTYRWAADGARATGDPRLDSNPFFERRLMTDTDRQLAARGFERRESTDADLVLHYHASVSQRLDVNAIDRGYGFCDGCEPGSLYDAGTILLDLVDARTNTLVWRAWAEGSLDGLVDDQQKLEQRIDDAVARIVATLPRRG